MPASSSRRIFLSTSAHWLATAPFAAALTARLSAQETRGVVRTPDAPSPAKVQLQSAQAHPKRPSLPLEKVQLVVGQAHRSLASVKDLVDVHPMLANASWDWGGGDFETPLQAAAHTGQREIAEYLLRKNARPDLFAAAMLGDLDFVRAAFVSNPRAHEIPGPHGFTLLHCAKQGGTPATDVVDWLIGRGAVALQLPLTLD